MNIYLKNQEAEFVNIIEFFKKDIAALRTGRANPAVLEGIQVEAYGVSNPLNGLANISVADSRSLTLAPWDKTVLKSLEKAIIEADLGLGVVNEGDKIRLTVPVMTEENRRELVKKLNERLEKAKISIRQVRDDVKTAIETAEEEKEVTEDDKYSFIQELEEAVAKYNNELKELRDKKEKEVMEI